MGRTADGAARCQTRGTPRRPIDLLVALALVGLASVAGAAPTGATPRAGRALGESASCVGTTTTIAYLSVDCGGATVSPATLSACSSSEVSLAGYLPGSTAEVRLQTAAEIATSVVVPIGDASTATATITAPAGLAPGPADVVVLGADLLGQSTEATVPVTVTACGATPTVTPGPAASAGVLPYTGADTGRLLGVAAGLLLLGGAAVYGSSRHRRAGTARTS